MPVQESSYPLHLLQHDIILDVPDYVLFPSLKILHLKYLEHLNDASIRKLLSASRGNKLDHFVPSCSEEERVLL
uniref:FBD domain-containing protein n=1 Tax=Salix viminalis TaxID=40686 RepID=A0A6N2KD35_SALVM